MKYSFLAVLLLFTLASFGQEKPALRVVVEGVGSEAVNCGIRKSAIEQVVARSLKDHGIALSKDESHPYLYVNVNAYRVMQDQIPVGCTTRLGVSVRAHSNPEPAVRGFKSNAGTYVILCEAGRLLSGAQREVAAAVSKTLEEDIKKCLSQLSY